MTAAGTREQRPDFARLVTRFDAGLPAWMTPRNVFLALLLISLVVDLGFGLLYKFRASPAQLEADERYPQDVFA